MLGLVVALGFVLLICILVIVNYDGYLNSVYIQGRRDGLIEAADYCHERGSSAMVLSPEGQLQLGAWRARDAFDAELEFRLMAQKIRP